ncbi:hypothetical protein D9613_006624 [Agrocybe pediades]|uniref:Uncharacterized protein n=1 Tax=Agrocybe pediades TaxID=84607 RepID=A0A8H4QI00_9AGAR|nr:hypothetical protein D9613_006624 [Agrocybe pediades]
MPSLVLLFHVDAPPLKKRRGLAGSIVSTAVSAALIGTAVGLTVYRFWRDRGKDGQIMDVPSSSGSSIDEDDKDSLPPPPYDAGAWKPAAQAPAISVPSSPRPKAAIASTSTPVATPRASVKSKRALQGSTRRPVGGSSRNRTRVVKHAHAAPSATRPEFDFGRAEVGMEDDSQTRTEVEDQMDWIGDKLSMLIEQGKRALQTEIVVMSEAKEDEVDDGRGEWEEEDAYDDDRQSVRSFQSRSRAGSVRKAKGSRPKNIMVPPSSSSGVGLGLYNTQTSGTGSVTSLSASPRRSTYTAPTSTVSTSYASATGDFAPSAVPSPFYTPSGTGHIRGISYESAAGLSSTQSSPSISTFSASVHDDPAGWESPELRESMERARARLLARRKGGV